MAVNRASVVDEAFIAHTLARPAVPRRDDLDAPVRPGTTLTARHAIELFEAQLESRMCDLVARELKNDGHCYYTIGSAGHEGSAAVAASLRPDDPAFLHYRSGAFYCARARQVPGAHGPLDIVLGLAASSDEPIAGGRHKVFGSVPLNIPPQTSTIASHLPKAVGCAIALDRRARLHRHAEGRIVVCTFGDASANHSTATGAFNVAGWAAHQNVPTPVLFVCEDNGIGISVRTPEGWTRSAHEHAEHLKYFQGDGLDLVETWNVAQAAAEYVRHRRKPAFLHLRTVRLLGHAGSDVEQLYRSREEIEADEANDPLLRTADLLIDHGWLTPAEVHALYEETRERIRAMGREAIRRPKLTEAAEVIRPLFRHDEAAIDAAFERPSDEARAAWFPGELPERSDRPRHLALQINRALHDLLGACDDAVLFGEDVARKGGVYHVTADLMKRFGVGRVFNTLLDEQSILGMAIGAGHAGLLPFPEIQYLAYLMNAIDQLRGEAGSMQFFSQGQYTNPMVVRVAGLAYQKGFGGHFHNDHGIAALLEIPGLLVGCAARGDDAARMLRTMAGAARALGRVCIFLEPIALYMTKDLHADGDGLWQTPYPDPSDRMPVGEIGVYGDGDQLTIASYANGLWMSLRVAERLRASGHRVRVLDLRWLAPLPIEAVVPHVQTTGRLLVVDECRRSSGIASMLAAEIGERVPGARIHRVMAPDSYVPLGGAANLVLVQEHDIDAAARALLEAP
jgi:2-oxoisovalerate dehydrogenase E1 component